jgi:hypothetical protein
MRVESRAPRRWAPARRLPPPLSQQPPLLPTPAQPPLALARPARPSPTLSADLAAAAPPAGVPCPRFPVCRPGDAFLQFCLASLHSGVCSPISSFSPLASRCSLWITSLTGRGRPPFFTVLNALNFHFSSRADRFSLCEPEPGVFSTSVASTSVAAAVLRRGRFDYAGLALLCHPSVDHARRHLRFQKRADVNASKSTPTESNSPNRHLPSFADVVRLGAGALASASQLSIHPILAVPTSSTPVSQPPPSPPPPPRAATPAPCVSPHASVNIPRCPHRLSPLSRPPSDLDRSTASSRQLGEHDFAASVSPDPGAGNRCPPASRLTSLTLFPRARRPSPL